jgi:uncharacterized protein
MNDRARHNIGKTASSDKRRKIEASFLGVALLTIAVFVVWAFVEPRIITVTEIEISDEDVPKDLDGLRMAHLSDIHHNHDSPVEYLKKVVDKTNGLHPDIVFITGDYTWGSNSEGHTALFEQLKRIKSRYGIFTVFGNHDSLLRNNAVFLGKIRDAKITVLENKAEWIKINSSRIKVGGVGDLWSGRQNISPTLENVTSKDFVILLSHNPDYAEEVPQDMVDLVLSGHTHGGQITFLGLYAPHLPIKGGQKYRSGLVKKGDMNIIVSKGIGTVGPKIRFFAAPEIVLITLRCEALS